MSKIKIAAAILEKDFEKIKKRVKDTRGVVDIMQIDVCDGKFVPSKTFASSGCESSFTRIEKLTKKDLLELDMMVDLDSPITGRFNKWMTAIKSSGAKQVIFHYGSTEDKWDEIFKILKGSKIRFGLGVHLHHKNSDIFNMIENYPLGYVQVMGIEKVGFGGQGFSNKTYAKVRAIRKKYPKIGISIDGGVKVDNAKKLIEAGATQLSSGSGIFKYEDGIKEAVNLMRKA